MFNFKDVEPLLRGAFIISLLILIMCYMGTVSSYESNTMNTDLTTNRMSTMSLTIVGIIVMIISFILTSGRAYYAYQYQRAEEFNMTLLYFIAFVLCTVVVAKAAMRASCVADGSCYDSTKVVPSNGVHTNDGVHTST